MPGRVRKRKVQTSRQSERQEVEGLPRNGMYIPSCEGAAPIEYVDEAGDAQEEGDRADKDASSDDVLQRHLLISQRDGCNGFHGLHWHGYAKDKPRGYIVQASENERGAQIQAHHPDQSHLMRAKQTSFACTINDAFGQHT